MTSQGKWGDLQARVLSAVLMLAVGLVAIWQGGILFHALIACVAGGMIWELTRLIAHDKPSWPIQMGAVVTLALFVLYFIPPFFVLPILLAPVLVALSGMTADRLRYALYAIGLLVACFGLTVLRDQGGLERVLWLILLVVATDIAGYFAGKMIGGPKFWPSLSPKKTWSGTSAGWVAAFVVGLIFGGFWLGLISVAVSFASQLGDISESALKRRAGVKDSSNLLPGHGGLLDRFDGLVAAALLVTLISAFIGLPTLPN